MRPPNPRLSDNGSGPDLVVTYALGFTQDAEGNEIRSVSPTGRTYNAIVRPVSAIADDGNGGAYSVTTYEVMLYTMTDPAVKVEDAMGWRGMTLRALSDSFSYGPGAWRLQAKEEGPNPEAGGYPAGLG